MSAESSQVPLRPLTALRAAHSDSPSALALFGIAAAVVQTIGKAGESRDSDALMSTGDSTRGRRSAGTDGLCQIALTWPGFAGYDRAEARIHGGVYRGERACEGGNNGGHWLKSVEMYDTSAGQWRALHIYKCRCVRNCMRRADLLAQPATQAYVQYDPVTGTCRTLPSMSTARSHYAALGCNMLAHSEPGGRANALELRPGRACLGFAFPTECSCRSPG